jgi:hypothetical protein
MKLAILSGLFGAACALASPVTVERDSRVTIKRDNDGLEWISQDDTLPKVLYVAQSRYCTPLLHSLRRPCFGSLTCPVSS